MEQFSGGQTSMILVSLCLSIGLFGCTAPPGSSPPSLDTSHKDFNDTERVKDRVREIFTLYEQESNIRLPGLLHENFSGSHFQFRDQLNGTFTNVESIHIDYHIDRIAKEDNSTLVRFHWDRSWTDSNTGRVQSHSGQTTFQFKKQAGTYYLKEINGTNPFF